MYIINTILQTVNEVKFVTKITDAEYFEYCYNNQYLTSIVYTWFSTALMINLIEISHDQALFQVILKSK